MSLNDKRKIIAYPVTGPRRTGRTAASRDKTKTAYGGYAKTEPHNSPHTVNPRAERSNPATLLSFLLALGV
jgi:hypothetical protein